MRAKEWNGFYLDLGCHLFSNDDDALTRVLLEIMQNQVIPVEFRYASITEGHFSDGFAVPDLSVLGREAQQRMLFEILAATVAPEKPAANLADVLVGRFGPTAAGVLARAAQKFLRADPATLDPSALGLTRLSRIKVVPDDIADLLKQHPVLDERLVASSQGDPFKYVRDRVSDLSFRSFYPAANGMHGFCVSADRALREAGVELRLGTGIEAIELGREPVCHLAGGDRLRADQIIWTLDSGVLAAMLFGENPLAGLVHKVPMIFYYFVTPQDQVGEFTYIQDFTPDHLLFRGAAIGTYGRQIKPDGTTFVCCEMTADIGSPQWQAPEEFADHMWREARAAGLVLAEAPLDCHLIKTPVSYSAGTVGYGAAKDEMDARIAAAGEGLVVPERDLTFRGEIVMSMRDLVAA